jgi:3-hydroxyacyl-CoA dehydrogenase/enoyl-CoA hydratase/3-hydroxybutyryl-CoA epimerase
MSSYLNIERSENIAIVHLDNPGEKVNTLNEQLIEEVTEFLDTLESDDDLIGAVLISDKEGNFIAGADLDMLKSKDSAEEVEELSRTGSNLLNRLEQSKKPVAAAIHGSTLGGGLEVAMACHYRVASNHSKTTLGQPEVKLGILPGAGGTQRLPRLIGLQKSLTYLLTGKNIYPRQAKKMGLVDELTHQHAVLDAGIAAVKKLAAGKLTPNRDKRSFFEKLLEGNPIGRSVIFSQARKKTAGQTKGNYPAPPKIIDCVEYGYKNGMQKGLEYESKQFGLLSQTRESKNLVNLFFGMQDSKKNPMKDQVRESKKLAVLGAGLMGSGIAEVSMEGGLHVLLKDQSVEQAAKGEKTIYDNLQKKVKKKILSSFDRDQKMSHVTGVDSYKGFDGVDLVIEAVFEDLDLKRSIVKEVEENTPDHTIFASNTSSLPITEIAKGSGRPEQILGMHYFSPVQKMPLLEIIKTEDTADWVTATAFDVGIKQGKNVIVVNDGPGFYTTRILAPFMNEALLLLEEGADIKDLDKAMKQFGYPVGPVKLLDEVGIDVAAHVGEVMSELFDPRGVKSSTKGQELLDAGYKGRKNKQGFYVYKEGEKAKEVNTEIYKYFGGSGRKSFDREQIQQRIALMMVNEAAWCLQEDILLSPADGDLGAILGLGFPPFLGGPFRYIDQRGVSDVIKTMGNLQKQHGERFKPAPILEDYAKQNKKFHS